MGIGPRIHCQSSFFTGSSGKFPAGFGVGAFTRWAEKEVATKTIESRRGDKGFCFGPDKSRDLVNFFYPSKLSSLLYSFPLLPPDLDD